MVIELPQAHFNVALALSRSVSDDFFVETADFVSSAYARLGELENAEIVGALVRETFFNKPDLDVSSSIRVLLVSNRGSSGTDEAAEFEKQVVERVLSGGTPRDFARLFDAVVVAPEPDPQVLRSVLDALYTYRIGDARTAALLLVARTVSERSGAAGFNAVVQQIIPSLDSSSDPVERFAAYSAASRFVFLLGDATEAAEFGERAAAQPVQAGTIRIADRDLPAYLQGIDDMLTAGNGDAALRVVDRTVPAASRAYGYLAVASQAADSGRVSEATRYTDMVFGASREIENAEKRIDVLQASAQVRATCGDRDGVLSIVSELETMTPDFGLWPDAFVALVRVSSRPEIETYLERSDRWYDAARVTTVLDTALSGGFNEVAEQVYAFVRTANAAPLSPGYLFQLSRMGKTREVLNSLNDLPYAEIENGTTLYVETLRTLPADVELDEAEKEALSRSYQTLIR